MLAMCLRFTELLAQDDREAWLADLQALIKPGQERDNTTVMEGMMQKRGGSRSGLNKRWCHLSKCELTYGKKKEARHRSLGTIPCSLMMVSVKLVELRCVRANCCVYPVVVQSVQANDAKEKPPHGFKLATPGRIYSFYTSSEEELQRWLKHLTSVITVPDFEEAPFDCYRHWRQAYEDNDLVRYRTASEDACRPRPYLHSRRLRTARFNWAASHRHLPSRSSAC